MELLVFIFLAGLFIALASWLFPSRNQSIFISIASCLLFFWLDWVSASILLASTTFTYFLTQSNKRKIAIALFVLLAIFVIVKFNQNFGSQKEWFGLIGFSFYMFRLIHLAIERYKGNLPNTTFRNWLEYLFFLPLLLVGPISRYEEFERETRRKRWNPTLFSAGLERLLYGWFKIIVLGNYVFNSKFDDWFSILRENGAWLRTYADCLQYAGNSYFQFAGYSDIAIGLALLMGIRVQENFNYPFLASSVNDFWKRWHISLSQWCRDYIYTPIASKFRVPLIGILASMLILGLWHEFSWRYILWGLIHGIGILVWHQSDKYLGKLIPNKKVKRAISTFFTFNFVVISFVFLKNEHLHETIQNLKTLFFITR